MKKLISKYILLLLFFSLGVAGNPFGGLWEIKHQDQHFYTEVYFQAELGIWIFEYTSYLIDLDGNRTDKVSLSLQMNGYYYEIKQFDNIIVCVIDKYVSNSKHKNKIDKNGNPFRFAFRLTSDTTATFGRIINGDIYEAYSFKRKDIE